MKVGRYADKFRWQDTQVVKSKVFCGPAFHDKGKAHHLNMTSKMDNSEPTTKVLFSLGAGPVPCGFQSLGLRNLIPNSKGSLDFYILCPPAGCAEL